MKRWFSIPNILAILAAGAIVVSLLIPWWGLKIGFMGMTYVYPYIIRGHNQVSVQKRLCNSHAPWCRIAGVAGMYCVGERPTWKACHGAALRFNVARTRQPHRPYVEKALHLHGFCYHVVTQVRPGISPEGGSRML